jgi:hypothetical protein
LADIDAAGAEAFQAAGFGFDVVDAQVEVDPGLAALGLGYGLEERRRVDTFGRE